MERPFTMAESKQPIHKMMKSMRSDTVTGPQHGKTGTKPAIDLLPATNELILKATILPYYKHQEDR